jgi:hypothetical protein
MRIDTCVNCNKDFSHDSGKRRLRCLTCRKENFRIKALERYWKNPEKSRLSTARWRENNKDKIKNYARKNSVRYLYGLSFEQYEKMLKEQDGKCFICGGTPNRELDVDHDHETKEVRKLLCNRCNRLIAILEIGGLDVGRKAIVYLESYASREPEATDRDGDSASSS